MRRLARWCVPAAVALAICAFLWLEYVLYLAPVSEGVGASLPVAALCLNPSTLFFDQADSPLGFSTVVLITDLLVYGAVGLFAKRLLERTARRSPLTRLNGPQSQISNRPKGNHVRPSQVRGDHHLDR